MTIKANFRAITSSVHTSRLIIYCQSYHDSLILANYLRSTIESSSGVDKIKARVIDKKARNKCGLKAIRNL